VMARLQIHPRPNNEFPKMAWLICTFAKLRDSKFRAPTERVRTKSQEKPHDSSFIVQG
jgi:hypothetical protein